MGLPYASLTHTEPSENAMADSGRPSGKQTVVIAPTDYSISRKEHQNARSLSTSIRQSNQGRRNSGNVQVLSGQRTVGLLTSVPNTNEPVSICGDEAMDDQVTSGSQHEIRIEISKTEVLDSMKKEH